MKIRRAIKLQLAEDPEIKAIIGANVYLRRVPQRAGSKRLVISQTATEWPARSNDPREDDDDRTRTKQQIKASLTLDIYSPDEDEVEQLAKLVENALDDFQGTMQDVKIGRMLMRDEHDNYEPRDDASDDVLHRITQEYEAWYLEPIRPD